MLGGGAWGQHYQHGLFEKQKGGMAGIRMAATERNDASVLTQGQKHRARVKFPADQAQRIHAEAHPHHPHSPQVPWSRMGVTIPAVTQFTASGRTTGADGLLPPPPPPPALAFSFLLLRRRALGSVGFEGVGSEGVGSEGRGPEGEGSEGMGPPEGEGSGEGPGVGEGSGEWPGEGEGFGEGSGVGEGSGEGSGVGESSGAGDSTPGMGGER